MSKLNSCESVIILAITHRFVARRCLLQFFRLFVADVFGDAAEEDRDRFGGRLVVAAFFPRRQFAPQQAGNGVVVATRAARPEPVEDGDANSEQDEQHQHQYRRTVVLQAEAFEQALLLVAVEVDDPVLPEGLGGVNGITHPGDRAKVFRDAGAEGAAVFTA